MDHYATEAVYETRTGRVEGRASIVEHFRVALGAFEHVELRTTWAAEVEDTVAVETDVAVTDASGGRRLRIPTMAMIRFRDGFVVEQHEYFDLKEAERGNRRARPIDPPRHRGAGLDAGQGRLGVVEIQLNMGRRRRAESSDDGCLLCRRASRADRTSGQLG